MSASRTRTRRNGEGSRPRLTPSGRWELRYTERGHRISVLAPAGATEAQAAAQLARLIDARDTGMAIGDRRVTVGSWLHRWYDVRVAAEARATTLANYRQLIGRIDADPIGRIRLHELRVDDVARFVGRLRGAEGRPLAPNTIRMYVAVLRASLTLAVRSGDIPRNVAAMVQLPKARPVKPVRPVKPAELAAVLRAAEGRDRYALAYALAGMAGLRIGEVLALRYRDLDPDRRVITVRASWRPSTGALGQAAHIGDPKSASGIRRVSMMANLVPLIAAHRLREWDGLTPHPDVFVFYAPGHERLRPVSHRTLQGGWSAACVRAGVRPARFHDLRHGYAEYCLDHGVGIDQVSAWLGHSGIGITAAIYGHRADAQVAPPPPMAELAV